MKSKADFQPDMTPPRSIKEIIEREISYTTYNGKTNNPLQKESLDNLMKRIYSHIEQQALEIYKSNEPWALKSYAYSHILTDATRHAALEDDALLSDLVSGLTEWQNVEFDPLLNLRRTLQFSGRKEAYVRECCRPAIWFVSKYGKKQRYTQAEILEFLDWLDKRYQKGDKPGRSTSSYVTRLAEFKRFLGTLPEDEQTGRRQVIPFEIPAYPSECHQPVFSPEEIDKMIYAAVMDEKPDVVLRLAVATIYGCRLGELVNLTSEHINLDHSQPTIAIPTEKRGERKPQPIPEELLQLFSIPLVPKKNYRILRDIRRVCRKAGVSYPRRGGVHCIRRSVVTALWSNTDLKEIAIKRFLRWSTGMGMGVMPRYVKTPVDVTDMEVLSKHPYLPLWKEMALFIHYLPQYQPYLNVQYIHIWISFHTLPPSWHPRLISYFIPITPLRIQEKPSISGGF